MQQNSRRKFLQSTAKAAAIITVSSTAASSILQSCAAPKAMLKTATITTGFTQQPLPYTYTALQPVIDAKTMEIHYTKHAAAYSKALLEAAQAEGIDSSKPLENVLAKIDKYSIKLRNNAGGHYNHEMFWKSLQPKQNSNLPTGKVAKAINENFGSFDTFKTQFTEAAKTRFGSGWAWLYVDAPNKLKIGSTPNQDNPLMNVSDVKGFPLLGLDVWEHAYYLQYQNKRADYIENWWSIINWNYVESRFVSKI